MTQLRRDINALLITGVCVAASLACTVVDKRGQTDDGGNTGGSGGTGTTEAGATGGTGGTTEAGTDSGGSDAAANVVDSGDGCLSVDAFTDADFGADVLTYYADNDLGDTYDGLLMEFRYGASSDTDGGDGDAGDSGDAGDAGDKSGDAGSEELMSGASDDPVDYSPMQLVGENYADCETCVFLFTGCTFEADGGSTSCAKTFQLDTGTLDISAMGRTGDTFTGSLTAATFFEIDDDTSLAITNGETRCISSHEFDETIR